jgi:hypothetical protein
MKRLLGIALVSTMCFGCAYSTTRVNEKNNLEIEGHMNSYIVREFEYDGCQYISVGSGDVMAIAHKGNCKYCQERGKKD